MSFKSDVNHAVIVSIRGNNKDLTKNYVGSREVKSYERYYVGTNGSKDAQLLNSFNLQASFLN